MSKLEKLSITGIRSFDPGRVEYIQFFSPLTLIVGLNGSGKTTIIECLKYATTGDLPPNSRKGAFVHDPKLVGEKEVKANVKLSFTATKGHNVVVTRALQVTAKKDGGVTQKSLSNNLRLSGEGETHSTSHRVFDVDKSMGGYLGVSKAVLDNVIFCHQDESLWPMSEPGTLKKKFDEIFEALKYTKAIENIKVMRKQQVEELGKLKINEQNAKENKERAERANKRSEQLWAEVNDLRPKLIEVEEKIKSAHDKATDATDRSAEFEVVVMKLESKRSDAQTKEDGLKDLKKYVRPMQDSDEELNKMLSQYEERTDLYRRDLESKSEQYHGLEADKKQKQEEQGDKQGEFGRYQAEKAHYDKQLRNREDLVKETARRHSIRGFDHELSEEQVRDLMERVSKLARDQNSALERARRDTQQEMHATQLQLNKLNERKATLNQTKEGARSQISSYDRKIATYQGNLDRMEVDEGAKITVQSNIKDLESRMQRLKSEQENSALDDKIRESEASVRSLENQKDQLDNELVKATNEAGDLARVDYLRKSLKDSQSSLTTMKAVHGTKLAAILGANWDGDNLETTFQRTAESSNSEVKEAESQRDGTQRELEQVESKLTDARSDKSKKENEKRECGQQILEIIDEEEVTEYPEVVKQLEKNRDTLKRDFDNFNAMKKYYGEGLEIAKDNDVCRLCERTFKNDKERQRFLSKMERIVAKEEADIENDLKTTEEELKALRDLRPKYDTWLRLSNNEMKELEAEIQRLVKMRKDLVDRVEAKDKTVNECLATKREIEAMSKTVQNMVKYTNEISTFERQIRELEAKQSENGLGRSLEEIRDSQSDTNGQLRAAQTTLNTLKTDRDKAKEQLSKMEMELRDANSKLSTLDFQLKERANLVAQIEDLKDFNHQQSESVNQADKELQKLAPEITQCQTKLDDVGARGEARIKELQEESSKLNNSVTQLKAADQDINAYIDRNGAQQLSKAEKELQNIKDEISSIVSQQTEVAKQINKIKEQQANHDQTRRSIEDNLRYRQQTRALESLHAEIRELEAQNADKDRDRWKQEAESWKHQADMLAGRKQGLFADIKSRDDQLAALMKEYEMDYKNAPSEYRKAHIKVEVTKAAIEDLGRYGGALDKAIMRYHSLKMEQINDIIEELWMNTYQGTDVDKIVIRSAEEDAKEKAASQKETKSYKYHVCMVKDGVDMEMRGRCSAGQKVLASIIIRLALAECFGANCGVIALDEPTTNLDRENIEYLAKSLHDLIRTRQQQSNFQLIVITHDEEFLKHMEALDFCDKYWRVGRDAREKSEIEKQSLAVVMGK